MSRAGTLGELRASGWESRSVMDERLARRDLPDRVRSQLVHDRARFPAGCAQFSKGSGTTHVLVSSTGVRRAP